jgi:hypothetical protein
MKLLRGIFCGDADLGLLLPILLVALIQVPLADPGCMGHSPFSGGVPVLVPDGSFYGSISAKQVSPGYDLSAGTPPSSKVPIIHDTRSRRVNHREPYGNPGVNLLQTYLIDLQKTSADL